MNELLEHTKSVDELEAAMLENFEMVDCPLQHTFTDKQYIREIYMPAGTLITSRIHKTEHPYLIVMGKVNVWTEESGIVHLEAPFAGITKPGTRRVLYIVEDCVWRTYHNLENENETLEEIEQRIIEPHVNEVLNVELKNNIISQLIEKE